MERLQPFNKLKLSQRRAERGALATRRLPGSALLKAQRVKKFDERFEFLAAGYMADCGDVLYHANPIVRPNYCKRLFYRPGTRGIFRRFVFFEQLLCQFHVLLGYLQSHAAGDLGCQRMDPVHMLIAQKTVYATGVQQALGDICLMQVIEDCRGLELVRVPVWVHATCPGNWPRAFPEKPLCLPSCLPSRSRCQRASLQGKVLPARSCSYPDSR